MIRTFTEPNWAEIKRIHTLCISGGQATFDAELPEKTSYFASRIPELRLADFVDETADSTARIRGWIAATRASPRQAYQGVCEHSVYIDPEFAGQGVAARLLTAFLDIAAAHGFWTVQCSIFRENLASQALHQKAGFRQIGFRERVGLMTYGPFAGQWRDTLIYEKRL